MRENTVVESGWLALAVSLPLFSVTFGRLNVGMYHLSIPAIVMAMLPIFLLLRGSLLPAEPTALTRYRGLLILTMLVAVTHGISMMQGYPLAGSLREFIKISSGIIGFWLILLFFPNDPRFLKRFITLSAGATVILLSILLYYYGILIKAPYLGTLFSKELSPGGKSHLAWFLTVLAPYGLIALFARRVSWFWIAANTLIGLCIIYAMCRASWIAMVAALGVLGVGMVKDRYRPNRTMAALLALALVCSVGLLMYHANLGRTLAMRIQSIYNPGTLPETPQAVMVGKYSRENRTMLMTRSLAIFRDHIWTGQGLATSPLNNGVIDSEVVTHNDYLRLLAETGLMGAIPFAFFLIVFARYLGKGAGRDDQPLLRRAAQASFLAICIQSGFIDSYTSVHYWFFLALALKAAQISQSAPEPFHASAA